MKIKMTFSLPCQGEHIAIENEFGLMIVLQDYLMFFS